MLTCPTYKMATDLFRLTLLLAVAVVSQGSPAAVPDVAERRHSASAATRRASAECPSFPLPVASPSALLSKLEPALQEAAANITAALQRDKSPGGVVVSFVYRDAVLWTKGFGLINASGKQNPSLGRGGARLSASVPV